jgi:hypothetical protein
MGFGTLFAIAGLLTVTYLLRRRGRNRRDASEFISVQNLCIKNKSFCGFSSEVV